MVMTHVVPTTTEQDFARETVVTALFTISLLVLPEIFALNKMPPVSTTGFCMIPLYLISVDTQGLGSTFAPNVLYSFQAVVNPAMSSSLLGQSLSRLAGVICGGIVAGKIMRKYFPDG
jgi:hypothetical protein